MRGAFAICIGAASLPHLNRENKKAEKKTPDSPSQFLPDLWVFDLIFQVVEGVSS